MPSNKSGGSAAGIIILLILAAAIFIFKDLFKWILIIAGIIVVVIIVLIVLLNKKEKQKKQELVAEGTTVADVERILKESNLKLQEIRRNYYKLKDTEMQKELDAISNQFRQIFKIVKEDPKDIKAARRYINATFTSLETIVNQSVSLFQAPNLSDEAKQTLKNAKEGMVLIREATDAQINKFYENNILDLDVELAVLKKSLSSRGLLDEDKHKDNDEANGKEQL